MLIFAAVAAASRPAVSALVWAGMGAATVLSGLAAPWLLGTHLGWRVAFALSAATALALALFFPPTQSGAGAAFPPASTGTFHVRRAFTRGWIFLGGSYLAFGVAYIAYATFVGTQLAAAQAPITVVVMAWVAFGATTIVGATIAIPILRSAALKRFALLAAAIAGAAGATVATGPDATHAFVGALLVGLGTAATPAIISAYARERTTVGEYPRAFSIVTSALGIGQLVGPAFAGALADKFGPQVVPVFAAAAYACAAVLAILDAMAVKQRES